MRYLALIYIVIYKMFAMQIKYQIFFLKNKVICINRPSQNLSLCNFLILQVEDAFLCIISCRLHKVEYVVRFISNIIKKRHSLYRKQSFSAMGVHYNGAIMSAMAYQITRLTVVYWTVYSRADERKHQSSAPLAFVRGIPRTVTRKMFPFDNVIMCNLLHKWHSHRWE